MVKKTYNVTGMHCPACEVNIERILKKIKGVKNLHVSLEEGQLILEGEKSSDLPSMVKLNALLYIYNILYVKMNIILFKRFRSKRYL